MERAGNQRGLLTRADLRAIGVSRGQLARLRNEGTISDRSPRLFTVAGHPTDVRHHVLAGCLDTGGAASHRTAAALHRLPGFALGPRPEVIVRGARSGFPTDLALVHSTTWLPADDLTSVTGIRCTSVARTLFSLAALAPSLPLDRARGAVDDAVRMGIATDPWLWSRLEEIRRSGRNGVINFEAILTARGGGERTESWLEREFLRQIRLAELPLPTCQGRIEANGAFVARVDFLYAEAGIVIEVTGAVAHATPEQRAADARRRNHLSMLGYIVLEFTYQQVVSEPDAMIAQIRAALAARSARRPVPAS